jgi:hypothetical protein
VSRIFNSPDFQRHYQAAHKIIGEEVSRAAIARLSGDRGGACLQVALGDACADAQLGGPFD